jgi:prephenate dehydratase
MSSSDMPKTPNSDSTIAIQGNRGSFHDSVACQFFGPKSQRVFCNTFKETFQALHANKSDYAVCAIENSISGSITEVYDLLVKNHCMIFGEVYIRVEQCLIGLPNAPIENIKIVYSQYMALEQCAEYLSKNLPNAELRQYHDTADSVRLVKDLNDPTIAAISGYAAAKEYGLEVLAGSIETDKENYTRFFCLANTDEPTPGNANKTSLVITASDDAGSLYRVLGSFAERDISISKIQSRPIVGKAWSYMFYIDALAGIQDERLQAVLRELPQQGCTVKVLGSYVNGLAK